MPYVGGLAEKKYPKNNIWTYDNCKKCSQQPNRLNKAAKTKRIQDTMWELHWSILRLNKKKNLNQNRRTYTPTPQQTNNIRFTQTLSGHQPKNRVWQLQNLQLRGKQCCPSAHPRENPFPTNPARPRHTHRLTTNQNPPRHNWSPRQPIYRNVSSFQSSNQ